MKMPASHAGAALSLYRLNLKAGLRSFVKSIDYFRYREYLMTIKEIDSGNYYDGGNTLLEIGCGEEIFGIYMALRHLKVTAADINQHKINLQRKYFKKLRLPPNSFTAELTDCQAMPYPDNTFNMATCLAVMPLLEGDGDVRVAQEIGRVLKPGGMAYITAGYAGCYREQRDVPGSRGFSRVYDEETVQKRIIRPSGLRLEKRLYFSEEPVKFSSLWYRLPFLTRLPLRWLIPLMTLCFLKEVDPDAGEIKTDKISGVFLAMRKARNY